MRTRCATGLRYSPWNESQRSKLCLLLAPPMSWPGRPRRRPNDREVLGARGYPGYPGRVSWVSDVHVWPEVPNDHGKDPHRDRRRGAAHSGRSPRHQDEEGHRQRRSPRGRAASDPSQRACQAWRDGRPRGLRRVSRQQAGVPSVSPALYLIDTSGLFRILQEQHRHVWMDQMTAGVIATCPLVELEFLCSARSRADRTEKRRMLEAVFGRVPMSDGAWERADEIQQTLTERGQHRPAGPVDLLVAATAEQERLILLCDDKDFEVVASVTGQPVRRVVDAPLPAGAEQTWPARRSGEDEEES